MDVQIWYILTMENYSAIKWSTDTSHNVDETWKHYTMWKKPDSKGHVLYDSVYVKGPE